MNRIALATLLVVLPASLAHAGTMVTVPGSSGPVAAYLATPAGAAKGAPAVVVVQEWWGLTDWVKQVADRFASRGYVAIAPDLYHGKVATDPELAHELMRGLPDARAIRDIRASKAYLVARKDLAPARAAVIGFCMGGRLAQLASMGKGPFDATVMAYGSPDTSPASIKSLKGPLLGIYGADDRGIGPDQTGPLQVTLAKWGKPGSAVHVFPGVGHAFLRDAGSPAGEEQAKLAWGEIDAFLEKQLKGKK